MEKKRKERTFVMIFAGFGTQITNLLVLPPSAQWYAFGGVEGRGRWGRDCCQPGVDHGRLLARQFAHRREEGE